MGNNCFVLQADPGGLYMGQCRHYDRAKRAPTDAELSTRIPARLSLMPYDTMVRDKVCCAASDGKRGGRVI